MPIWLLDRYQVEAAAKSIGGMNFPYVVNGENGVAQLVPGSAQWASLYGLLDTLLPAELTVPARLNPLLSSGFGGDSDRQTEIEIIPTAGGPVFDPLKATEVGAVQTLDALLAPERLNGLEGQHAADASVPAPSQLFDILLDRTLSQAGTEVGRRIATMSILALAGVQHDASLSPTISMQLAGASTALPTSWRGSEGLQRNRIGHEALRVAEGPTIARWLARGASGLDVYGWMGSLATYGFIVTYALVAAALPAYLRRHNAFRPRYVVIAALACLAMLLALAGNLYPVPEGPYGKLPYIYLIYLSAGVLWFWFNGRPRKIARAGN